LEIHVFSPSSRHHPSSSRVAVEVIETTSLPAAGSERAKAAIASPRATPGRYRALSASLPKREMGPLPSPCMAKAKSASPS